MNLSKVLVDLGQIMTERSIRKDVWQPKAPSLQRFPSSQSIFRSSSSASPIDSPASGFVFKPE
ncbi:hypothetical protein [Phaffia rhodozyma]|uniref:Uncharacterized protein n=1 Tax=Phaffia rhodozyma TaxID=264483 RepID=A0A0F7SGJ2_PHARH|nr:hypothetical protein [Phaffia rhodozyma]